MARFADLLTGEQYELEQALVRELLETEIANGRDHLQRFLDEWDRLTATNQRF